MHAFTSDQFVLPLPEGHRFPMRKYSLLREAVALELPQVRLREAPRAADFELVLAHDQAYVARVGNGTLSAAEQREIGFPWSQKMAERSRRSVGATLAACERAFELGEGVAANLAGGTHHAYAHKGAGFCVFNDLAVATLSLQMRHPGLRVLILDLDVHQGNGTAAILGTREDVFTVSLHGQKNYPFRKEASHLDVDLADGTTDAAYLDALEHALAAVANRFDAQFMLYLAGADPHEGDRLGRLRLTTEGLLERDRRVFAWAAQRRIACAFCMGGGYGRVIEDTVAVQLNTYRAGAAAWAAWGARGKLAESAA